jgi:hypothetical protein
MVLVRQTSTLRSPWLDSPKGAGPHGRCRCVPPRPLCWNLTSVWLHRVDQEVSRIHPGHRSRLRPDSSALPRACTRDEPFRDTPTSYCGNTLEWRPRVGELTSIVACNDVGLPGDWKTSKLNPASVGKTAKREDSTNTVLQSPGKTPEPG